MVSALETFFALCSLLPNMSTKKMILRLFYAERYFWKQYVKFNKEKTFFNIEIYCLWELWTTKKA